MLIRRADLPSGFVPSAQRIGDFRYCGALDESDLTITAEGTSPSFLYRVNADSAYSVSTQGRLFRSAGDARASWDRWTGSAGERCLRDVLTAEMLQDGVALLSFERIAFPAVAPRTVAYRIEAAIRDTGPRRVHITWRIVRMQRGRGEVTLWFGGRLPTGPVQLVPLARLSALRLATATT